MHPENKSEPAAKADGKQVRPARVLSGIQPTGRFHWGNYFGAIRQYIELQTAGDAFYFIAVAPMGLLERCHAYKDKKMRGLTADAGLFTYPVLMSADILAYDATIVPVGEDQVQHIEVCRDLAGTFNHLYGDVFTLPKPRLVEAGGRVPGTDGQKMSKSYDNTLDVFEDL